MAFYKVVLNGTCQEQDIKNILYYRTGIGVDISGLTVGGTRQVAEAVRTMVWTAMKAIMPTAYSLETIDAYVYDTGTFNLLYQNPTSIGVNESGVLAGEMNGPATCAIVNFELEPTMILTNGVKPPKKGYLAIGPLLDSWIDSDGKVRHDVAGNLLFAPVLAALSNNVETLIPPAVFFPVRMHQDKVLGVFKFTSFADISGAHIRPFSSFRRSRMPEL